MSDDETEIFRTFRRAVAADVARASRVLAPDPAAPVTVPMAQNAVDALFERTDGDASRVTNPMICEEIAREIEAVAATPLPEKEKT